MLSVIETEYTYLRLTEFLLLFFYLPSLNMLPGEIQACDRGDEYELDPNSVKLCSSATYTVQVEAFNYMAPVIDVPGADERIRLR